MPKTYLTLAERQKAENEKFNDLQDDALRTALLKSKKSQHTNNEALAQKGKLSVSTVQKIFDVNKDLGTVEIDKLRSVCFALGVKLRFVIE